MRRLVLLAVGFTVSMLFGAAPAMADNGPHIQGAGPITDSCAGCHRAHTADAPSLLKEDQTDLCFACHGSAGAGSNLDVKQGISYAGAGTGALRGGGFEYALIDTDNPTLGRGSGVIPVLSAGEKQPTTSTHSINSTGQTAWGFGPISASVNYGKTVNLSCGNCHDPHGNGNYRILRSEPRELWSYYERKEGKNEEVTIPDAETTKDYTTTNYWRSDDTNALGFAENIAAWCSLCHTRYKADHQGSTDSGDAVYKYRHSSGSTSQGGGQRSCIQCHVAHGSNASMGTKSNSIPFPDGSSASGDSRLLRLDNRGVCQMCHEK